MPTGLPEGLTRTDRPVLMGVVNVTPDSFSDGGRWATPEAAIAHGRELLLDGADILDVGGESTRPGATRPLVTDELARVVPVISALAGDGATVSVDTMRSEVALAAVEAGAKIVNDVSGGLADPRMHEVVAASGAAYVAMHWRAHSTHMQSRASYDDVVQDVCRELTGRVEDLCARGVRREQIVLDPGFGFAKLAEHSWRLLAHLDRVQALGFPVLVGTSRKSFLGRLGVPEGAPPRPAAERDAATAATTVIAGLAGAWGVRVHHVPSSLDALRVVAAMEAAR